jgi:branched-chain amino acid transport system ATP-binding protein
MSELLRCQDVAKKYGGVVALRGVDFHVSEGEIVGLVGANGAGKSTLIDIISGITPPTSGRVMMAGQPVRGGAAKRSRHGIARTFQMPQYATELTLRENIAAGLAGRRIGNWWSVTMQAALALVGVPGWGDEADRVSREVGLQRIDRLASEVSFGELRLVEVARALIQQPRLVMLDEPFPGLDETGVAGVMTSLRHLRDRGHGVLLVDHNVDMVASVVDRIVLLADGEIVLSADVETCLKSAIFRERYLGVK